MSSEKRYKVIENVIYLVLWILVFAAPVISMAVRSGAGQMEFSWKEVWRTWLAIVPFFAIFVIHNFFIAKYFFVKGKRWLYFLLTLVLLAVHPGASIANHGQVFWDFKDPGSPEMTALERPDLPIDPFREKIPELRERRPLGPIDVMALARIAMAFLLLALNLLIKWMFKSRITEQRMLALEAEMTKGQLQQLRYQINPHFFMNTLNNIHALVDIDPQKAKSTIIELSSLMRYVLYDSPDGMLTIDKEKLFLEKYLDIMSIRYSDKVTIKAEFDVEGKEAKIPSMLLVTFLENAFKHGVTYKKESRIDTSLRIEDDRILFSCSNTKRSEGKESQGGIGIENARKRLDLIYGTDYKINVDEDDLSYTVSMNLPLMPKE